MTTVIPPHHNMKIHLNPHTKKNILGPCSAEGPQQLRALFGELIKYFGHDFIFRAGVWKPRTRPGNFEGKGEMALGWLKELKEEFSIPVIVEVGTPYHVEKSLKYDIDGFWIGARTTASPFAVEELALSLKNSNIPVFIKNPINPDLFLWIGAFERFLHHNVKNIAGILRGFSQFHQGLYRNAPLWPLAEEMRQFFPEHPFFCDPSHIAGKRELVPFVIQESQKRNFAGMMIEVHPFPEKALSDSKQQMTPLQLSLLLQDMKGKIAIKEEEEKGSLELALLRDNIDELDKELILVLKKRFEIIKHISSLKKEMGMSSVQMTRYEELLQKRLKLAQELGISQNLTQGIFEQIHLESLEVHWN